VLGVDREGAELVFEFKLPVDLPAPVTQPYGVEYFKEPMGYLGPNDDIQYRNVGALWRPGRFHNGIDYGVPCLSPVYAAGLGIVRLAGMSPSGFGLRLVINHGVRVCTLYGHLSFIAVDLHAVVKQGDLLGFSGGGMGDGRDGNSDGCHLHFSVLWLDGGVYHDPIPYFKGLR
jgi:murein DD-endopeptidase MepM/ murein hydrolase activator NlpD